MSRMILSALIMAGLGGSLAHEDVEKTCWAISTVTTDSWCEANCARGNCPPTLCKCGDHPPHPPPSPGPPGPPEPSPPVPPAPLDPLATVQLLNQFYMGFDENNPKSPLGVTMTMTSNPGTFFGNVYCSTFDNPHGKTGCHTGFADCRLSTSLYNHKMITNPNKVIVLGLKKTTGFVLNQTKVESLLSKCSYVWDGASQNRLNNGCGTVPVQGALDCKSPFSAFANYCPSIKGTCTADAAEVKDALCTQYGGKMPIPTYPQAPACMFPGPALDWHHQNDYKPAMSYLRDMTTARMAHNEQFAWNEVIIDETLLLKDIAKSPEDAAQVVTAFIYGKSGLQFGAKSGAEKMRDEFCKYNKIKTPIPVIEIDDVTFQPGGPFGMPSEEAVIQV